MPYRTLYGTSWGRRYRCDIVHYYIALEYVEELDAGTSSLLKGWGKHESGERNLGATIDVICGPGE